jgi:hypothetical protein
MALTRLQEDLFDFIAGTLEDQRDAYNFFIARVEGGKMVLFLPAQSGRRVEDRPINPADIAALEQAGLISLQRVRQQVNISVTEAGKRRYEQGHRR